MKTSYFIINPTVLLCLAFLFKHGWIYADNGYYGFNIERCNPAKIEYNTKQMLKQITQRYEQKDTWNYHLWFLIVQNSLKPIYIELNKYDLKTALIDFAHQVAPLKLSCSQGTNNTIWNETIIANLPLGCVHINSQYGTKFVGIKVHELFAINLTFVEFDTMGDDQNCLEITRVKILLRLGSNSQLCHPRDIPDLCGRRKPLTLLLKYNDVEIILFQNLIWAAYYIRFVYQVIDFDSIGKQLIHYNAYMNGKGKQDIIGSIQQSATSK